MPWRRPNSRRGAGATPSVSRPLPSKQHPHQPSEEFLMARVIEVTVSPTGETSIQTRGYAGADCLQASKFLEQTLGVPSAEHKTAEYYETQSEQQHVQQ